MQELPQTKLTLDQNSFFPDHFKGPVFHTTLENADLERPKLLKKVVLNFHIQKSLVNLGSN